MQAVEEHFSSLASGIQATAEQHDYSRNNVSWYPNPSMPASHSHSSTLGHENLLSSVGRQRCRLPVEIWERIIDIVAEFWDYHDFLSPPRRVVLRHCALTCRGWHPRSRYHLFYTSDLIENADHLSSYVGMLRAHRDLTSLVQRLRISSTFDNGKAYWINSLPISLSPLLSNLNHIIFTAQVSKSVVAFHPMFFQALAMFKSVTELHYTCHAKQPFENFSRFVLAFSNLHELHVDGESVWEQRDTGAMLIRPFSRRRRLRLHRLHLSVYVPRLNLISIIGFVLTSVDTSSLKRLEIWDVGWRDGNMNAPRAVGKLIGACEHLHGVVLHIRLLGSYTTDSDYITFKNNVQLRTLDLQISYLPDAFKLFIRILSTIKSQYIRHLTLRFNSDAQDIEHALARTSGSIDDILARSEFRNLTDLSTDLPPVYWPRFFRRLCTRNVFIEKIKRMDSESLHELWYPIK